MTTNAKMATGMLLSYNGTVYAELTEIGQPPLSIEKIDVTSHDSTHKVSIPGQSSFGDLTFKGNFSNDTAQAALRVLAIAKTVGVWSVTFPAGFNALTYTLPGFVSSYKLVTPLKGAAATFELSITPSESILEVATVGVGILTTPWLVMTDDDTVTQVPLVAWDAGTRTANYVANSDSVHLHVTATAVAPATAIYIDGVLTASAAPSAAIPYALADYTTGSIKVIYVVVYETMAKTPVVYKLVVTRGLVPNGA